MPRRAESEEAGGLAAALDRARFGAMVLDLHPLRPTALQAAAHVRRWVLEKQVAGAREALIITGRGRHSPDGTSPVRDAVSVALTRLTRDGVVQGAAPHTEGSFVVTFAPLTARLDAAARRRDPAPPPPSPERRLQGLPDHLVEALEDLAAARLDRLGVQRATSEQVVSEMRHVFSRLVRERALSDDALSEAIARARAELDEDPDR